jgi:hypothetical protein
MAEKSYIDIGRWWLKDGLGKPMSVNAIFESVQGTENEIGRYTLARARDGKLEKADIRTIEALIRVCSIWAGKDLTFEDLRASNEENANFNQPIAA